jgi:hypothetical protein
VLVGSPKLSAALQRLDLVDDYRFGARSVLVFRPTAIIAAEVRGRDTAQIGHRGVALSPALAAFLAARDHVAAMAPTNAWYKQ